MEKADELEERLIEFAVAVIRLTEQLPKSPAGTHIGNQVLRCGTSPAPNYGEARGAESRPDFIHKLGIVRKELNETLIWLKIAKRSGLVPEPDLSKIMEENLHLCRIINASVQTLRKKKKPENEK